MTLADHKRQGARTNGMRVLADVPIALNMVVRTLPKNGGHAQVVLPRLKAIKAGEKWEAMVRTIEQEAPGKDKPMSFEEARV